MSRIAAVALVGILIGLGLFGVRTNLQGQDTRASVATAQDLSRAYADARLAVAEAEAAAYRYTNGGDASALWDYRAAAAATEAAIGRILAVGGREDRALILDVYEDFFPALAAADEASASSLDGPPNPRFLPDISAPQTLRDLLATPAEQQLERATSLAADYERQQQTDLQLTLVVYSAGVVLVVALLIAARAFGRRELVAASQLAFLQKVALTDALTALGNRRAFEEELRTHVASASRHHTTLSLAILDVDEFKAVNDTWGHDRGDELLRALAQALRENCRAEDRAFRIGGDEFAMLFPHASAAQVLAIVDRIRVYVVETLNVQTTLSVGVAELGPAGDSESLLRQQADAALYDAKLKGRNRAVSFDGAGAGTPAFPAAKLDGLQRLLADGRVDVQFQPIRDLRQETVLAYEAIPVFDPSYQLDSATHAFQLAERIQRVSELDALCRARALMLARQMPGASKLFLRIAPSSLADGSFNAERIRREVVDSGLSPERVVLEITEQSPVSSGVIATAIVELRKLGFRVALDDVGGGSGGLETLRLATVDYVKVDAGAISAAAANGTSRAALMAILVFAAEAGATVVAEGVEDETMLTLVNALASGPARGSVRFIHGGQGDFLGRPGPGFEVETATTRAA